METHTEKNGDVISLDFLLSEKIKLKPMCVMELRHQLVDYN